MEDKASVLGVEFEHALRHRSGKSFDERGSSVHLSVLLSDPVRPDPPAPDQVVALLDGEGAGEFEHVRSPGVDHAVNHLPSLPLRGDQAAPFETGQMIGNAALRRAGQSHQLRDAQVPLEERFEHVEPSGIPEKPEVSGSALKEPTRLVLHQSYVSHTEILTGFPVIYSRSRQAQLLIK